MQSRLWLAPALMQRVEGWTDQVPYRCRPVVGRGMQLALLQIDCTGGSSLTLQPRGCGVSCTTLAVLVFVSSLGAAIL